MNYFVNEVKTRTIFDEANALLNFESAYPSSKATKRKLELCECF